MQVNMVFVYYEKAGKNSLAVPLLMPATVSYCFKPSTL